MIRSTWEAACSVVTAAVSIVCMGSMTLATVGAGATAGAGASSVAAMGSMQGMASSSAAPDAVPLLPSLIDRFGLGFLNHVPNEILQPLLIALVLLGVGLAYLNFRAHRRPQALVLTAVSGLVM
jgi:hypothetical protein